MLTCVNVLRFKLLARYLCIVNEKNYRWLLYLISLTILITIGAQIYWNNKQYTLEKRKLAQEVLHALDQGMEEYYSRITQDQFKVFDQRLKFENSGNQERNVEIFIRSNDTIGIDTVMHQEHLDILHDSTKIKARFEIKDLKQIRYHSLHDISAFPIDSLVSKVFVALTADSLKLDVLKQIVDSNLSRRGVYVPNQLRYSFTHMQGDLNAQTYGAYLPEGSPHVQSNSLWLLPSMKLEIVYSNDAIVLLKGISGSLLLSLVLSILIISCLVYALRTISRQKKLSDMKNDLISNISHEFKTPISTIGVALESLQDSDHTQNQDTRDEYLTISRQQLGKLTTLVENLLESAKASGNEHNGKTEPVIIDQMVQELIKRVRMLSPDMVIDLNLDSNNIELQANRLHLEKAVMNIFDNAIKYGGDALQVISSVNESTVVIEISDNGDGIPANEHKLVFEQFYRRPTGNIHDVKGYGIGLYFTKKVIENHGGTIGLRNENDRSVFIIKLPK